MSQVNCSRRHHFPRRTDRVERAQVQLRGAILALSSLLTASSFAYREAYAQYVFNPASADEAPGIKYFGSAKDASGALLPDVSIRIISDNLTYVLVTDEQGRFRENVMLDMVPEKVTIKCFKEGYQLIHLYTRPGASTHKQTVQVDCVLRASKPK